MKNLLLLILSLLPLVGSATVPLSAYEEFKDEPFMVSHLWGATSGILTLSAVVNEEGSHRLFCIPPDLVISNEEAVNIFVNEAYDDAGKALYADETPISMIFILALKKLYPCKASQ